jgi:uncharacterized membrane protein
MKKWKIATFVVIIVGIGLYFTLAQPKLDANVAGTTKTKQSVVVTLDNDGFQDIHIQQVYVNDNQKPEIAKLQGNGKGFVISDTFDEKEFYFYDYRNTPIPPLKKGKDNTKFIDKGYALSLHNKTVIHSINITYTYLGKTFHRALTIN